MNWLLFLGCWCLGLDWVLRRLLFQFRLRLLLLWGDTVLFRFFGLLVTLLNINLAFLLYFPAQFSFFGLKRLFIAFDSLALLIGHLHNFRLLLDRWFFWLSLHFLYRLQELVLIWSSFFLLVNALLGLIFLNFYLVLRKLFIFFGLLRNINFRCFRNQFSFLDRRLLPSLVSWHF